MMLLAGALAGGVWGAIPGFLRARFGANEVIATLMLNVLAGLLATYLVNGPLQQGGCRRVGDGAAAEGGAVARPDRPARRPARHRGVRAHADRDRRRARARRARRAVPHGVRLRAARGRRRAGGREARRASTSAAPRSSRWRSRARSRASAARRSSPASCTASTPGLSPGYGFIAIAVALVGNLDPLWIIVAVDRVRHAAERRHRDAGRSRRAA